MSINPDIKAPLPPQPTQQQDMPGTTDKMLPTPDHGETSYKGSGRLEGAPRSSQAVTPASAVRSPSPMPARARMC